MAAWLIKIFRGILRNLRFIKEFMRMSFNAHSKHEYSKPILVEFLKIHFNIILPYSHRPSEWTVSFTSSNQKSVQDYLQSHVCHIPHPFCQCSFIILASDKQYKLWNSTFCIFFLPFPLSLVQTLF